MANIPKYEYYLRQYCNNNDVRAFLQLAKVQYDLDRERYYSTHGKYPEPRDLISKMLYELDIYYADKMEQHVKDKGGDA